jgi:ABC-type transport system involved in multi-copper enzyme maturation permease subunit
MWNTIAAAFQLTNLQVVGRKRRLVTLIVLLLPLAISFVVRKFGPQETNQGYAQVVSGMLALFLVPFISVFWGSALLTDEVEGKTLVFLWTRPSGRARLFGLKYIALLFWLLVLCAISVLSTYLVLYSRDSLQNVRDNLMITVWDTRALLFGAACYAALAFFFATVFKKPVTIGLLYAYLFDSIAFLLPGFLKRLSVRHNVLSLTTHPSSEKPSGFLKLLTESNITEAQAMGTLLISAAVLVILGLLILRNKEYLGDDPARTT